RSWAIGSTAARASRGSAGTSCTPRGSSSIIRSSATPTWTWAPSCPTSCGRSCGGWSARDGAGERARADGRVSARGPRQPGGALPVGRAQTISQPVMVARACERARVGPDAVVLDVGTGSGYQAAVLAELAGSVVSIERIPELAEEARQTLDALGYGEKIEVVV